MSLVYRALMFLGSWWCHQLPERSPHLFGVQMPLCWRCTGIFFGALALFCWLLRKKRFPPLLPCVLLALLLPLDVLHAVVTHGDGDNARRLITGLLWGFCGTAATLLLLRLLALWLSQVGAATRLGLRLRAAKNSCASR
ncbi:MAG: hypothetical protein QOC99_717 [Acidobacteriota bacterium]|jgi:uncharacterized membrane protein|nr:hypothetical protein [Acidobacteriota bacterium]MDT7778205.1 hypothetical protein [Acidobacteriota bacterium]